MKRYHTIFCMLAAAGMACAQPGSTAIVVQQYSFAPVGIVSGQTLRLNVANLAGGTSVCMGDLSFVNSDGTTIKNQNFTVNAGQTTSFTLQTTDISGSPASAEIRGVAKVNRQAGGVIATPGVAPIPACSALMSLEIVDATGQTHLVLTNPTLVSGLIPILTPLPLTGVN